MGDIVDDARDYADRMMQGHAAGLVNHLVRDLLTARGEIERLRALLAAVPVLSPEETFVAMTRPDAERQGYTVNPYADLRARLAPLAAMVVKNGSLGIEWVEFANALVNAYPEIDALLARGEAAEADADHQSAHAAGLATALRSLGYCPLCETQGVLASNEDDNPEGRWYKGTVWVIDCPDCHGSGRYRPPS